MAPSQEVPEHGLAAFGAEDGLGVALQAEEWARGMAQARHVTIVGARGHDELIGEGDLVHEEL